MSSTHATQLRRFLPATLATAVRPLAAGLLLAVGLAGTLTLGTPAARASSSEKEKSKAPTLVPYLGEVRGTVVSDFTLQNPTASATIRSHPFGSGVQAFDNLSLTLGVDGANTTLETSGIATTTHPSGRTLCIAFTLRGVFTSPSTVVYTGNYEVLAEGTTVFKAPASATDLGEGLILGSAVVTPDPVTGTLTFAFTHRFAGTVFTSNRDKR